MKRGTLGFDLSVEGQFADTAANVERLRELWLGRALIDGEDLGPGDAGDFDHGAWHVACHLIGAAGVRRAGDGRILWLEVSHAGDADEYFASVTAGTGSSILTSRLDSAEGQTLLRGSSLLGFVEGNSVGRISARGVVDPPSRFNGWLRQDFNQSLDSSADGGKVWEHWCTVRDIRTPHRIADSVLRAFVTLTSALGDRFIPTVARGRRSYGHPKQLCAMVKAGLTSEEAALWDVTPQPIPPDVERVLLEASPGAGAAGAAALGWGAEPRYYMFSRRIASWSPTEEVARDLRAF